MKKVMMLVVAAISIAANADTRIFNLYDELKTKGYTVSSLVSGSTSAVSFQNAFDGVKGGTSGGERWIASIPSAYVAIKIPEEIATKSRIVGYRIWRLTNGSNELNRSPLACELRGVTQDDAGNIVTNVLSTVSQISQTMSWSGPVANEQFNEVYDLNLHGETCYTEYIWVPTSTEDYKGGNKGNNFGLMELELLMSDDISDTTQYMNFNAKRFGNEVVPVTVEPKSSYDSIYKVGSKVTLTVPATDEGRNFSRWYGTGFDEPEKENRTIEFTIGTDNKATPFYDGMWMLAWDEETRVSGSQTGTITEQSVKAEGEANWKFNVVENREAYTCTLGLNGDAGNVYYRNDGTIIGSGKCDLSTKVCDSEGNIWKITSHFNSLLFASSSAIVTEIIYPKTMKNLSGQFLNGCSDSLTNVVVDCPEATGSISPWTFGNNHNLKRLILKCPGIEKLQTYVFRNSPLTDTDTSEWDLSGVTELDSYDDKSEPGIFQGFGGRGILRLPSIKKIEQFSFHGANNLEGVVLGSGAGTVTSIATNAFTGNCGIRKLVIGGAEGWTLAEKSITLSKGLTEIVFLTTPPAALEAGKSYFTELDTAAKKCGIFVPYQSAEWSQIFAAATEAADPDDVEAYLDANEGAARPNFVLPAGVLGTQYAQLLGYAKTAEYGGTSVKVDFSTVEGSGDEIITSSDGVHSPGEVVTINANCAEGNTFYAWHGLPSGSTNVTEVSFTVGYEPLSILLHSFHSWTYDPDAKQITDGNWVLNVYVANSGEKRLGLGVNASGKTNDVAAIGSAYTGTGSGALELNGPVVNVNDSTDIWSITDFGASCFSLTDDNGNNALQASITQLYMPTNTKSIRKMMYSKTLNETLKYLWINAPEFAGNVEPQAFQGQKIAKASIYLPKTLSLGNRCFQDIVDVEGVLKFPYLTYFGNNAFSGTGVDEVELGTGYTLRDHAKLDDGNKDNFQECLAYNPTLTKITFGPYESVSFHEKAFTGNTGYKNIVFQGKPLAKKEIDKILVSIGDITNGVNNVIINASLRLGWDEYAVDELDEEKQFYPAGVDVNKILGVYLGANNSRKAWIVDTESPFDPKGTVIIIR